MALLLGELDDYEVEPFNVIDRGLTVEQLQKEQTAGFDSKYSWKDVAPNNVRVSIGVAVGQNWDNAKKEINFVRSKLKSKCGSERAKVDSIFDLIFGQ